MVTIDPTKVTAAHSQGTATPELAFDGSLSTAWNSGGFAPQWLQIDLGAVVPVSRIRLAVNQVPAGATTHVISVVTDDSLPTPTLREIRVVSGETQGGQWLEVPIQLRTQILRITTTLTPSWVSWSEIEVYQNPNVAPQHFGYFCSECEWVGDGSYASETSDHANLVWIGDDRGVEYVIARIEEAARLKMKSIVMPRGVFFPRSAPTELDPNYQSNWDTYAHRLAPYINEIAAFYPVDEPDFRFSDETVTRVVAAIKTTFPEVPTAVIYSPRSAFTGHHPGVLVYDWVSLDCYSTGQFKCFNGPTESVAFDDAYYALRSLLDPARQRTFLIPQAGMRKGYAIGEQAEAYVEALGAELDQVAELARRDLMVVGLMPFIYQSFESTSGNWTGLEAFPTLRAEFVALARALAAESAAAVARCQQTPDAGLAAPDASWPADSSTPPPLDAAEALPGQDAGELPDAATGDRDAEGPPHHDASGSSSAFDAAALGEVEVEEPGCGCSATGPVTPLLGLWGWAAWASLRRRALPRAAEGRGRGR
ncbi:MAG: discoidin domain-containing protein [Deltaproteobacteria bacterium]|nr:discoidin domain-containing protein [Deltaproteobacteria bacterium]